MLRFVSRSARRGLGRPLAGFALAVGLLLAAPPAPAKEPGHVHCYNGICHRVLTLEETAAEVGKVRPVLASYYDDPRIDRFNPGWLTSSGAIFDANAPGFAASPVFPDGTILSVHNPANGLTMVVRINDGGPYHGARTLDLTRAGAERLGTHHAGVALLTIRVIYAPKPEESAWRFARRFEPVPGQGEARPLPEDSISPELKVAVAKLTTRSREPVPRAGPKRRTTRIVLLPVRERRASQVQVLRGQQAARRVAQTEARPARSRQPTPRS